MRQLLLLISIFAFGFQTFAKTEGLALSLNKHDISSLSNCGLSSITAACNSYAFRRINCNEPITTSIDTTLCDNEDLLIADSLLTIPGEYTFPLLAANGCDSILQLSLDFAPTYIINLDAEICAGECFVFDGLGLDATGEYIFEFYTEFGCDSIYIINLIEHDPIFVEIDTSIQSGDMLFGQTIFGDTTLVLSYASHNACDSIVSVQAHIITDLQEEITGFQHFVVPNPSQGQIPRLRLDLPISSEADLLIMNAQGRILSRRELHLFAEEQEVVLSELNDQVAGLYFYRVQLSGGKILSGEFIIQ